jgi:hypothetical protein
VHPIPDSLPCKYVCYKTPGKEKFYGIRQYKANELAVLKLKYIIILSTQLKDNMKRKLSTKILARKFEPAVFRSRKCEA